MTTIAIHQPNFLPWAGYFRKMLEVDTFIFLDQAQYTKNSFQNRNRIIGATDLQWLTIPALTKGFSRAKTSEIRINYQVNWVSKHLKTIKMIYGRHRFYESVIQLIEDSYSNSPEFLVDLNISLISKICEFLQIDTPTTKESELDVTGASTERLINLVKASGGTQYLSGSGGLKYMNLDLFRENSISLAIQSYTPEAYEQPRQDFVSGLSILDVLFNLGPDAANWLRGGKYEWLEA